MANTQQGEIYPLALLGFTLRGLIQLKYTSITNTNIEMITILNVA